MRFSTLPVTSLIPLGYGCIMLFPDSYSSIGSAMLGAGLATLPFLPLALFDAKE